MRSTIAAAAFAMGALAVPYNKARDVVTDVDVVYATEYVTVYAGDEPTSTPAPAPTTSAVAQSKHYAHSHAHGGWTSASTWATTWTSEVAAPSSSSAAPASSSEESSTYVAPTTSSTYVAPTTSSTYVAPTTSMAPAYSPPATSSVAPAPSSYSAASSSSSAAAAPTGGLAPTDYSGIAVFHHNLHRANHSAPDIEWSDALAATAQKTAETCVYAHDTETDKGNYASGYGQNIAAGVQSDNISAIITDLFYNGEVNWFTGLYDYDTPDMTNFEKWGHFSQIVWRSTTQVGCYTNDCTSQGLANTGGAVSPYFTVCNYATPGNYGGEYKDNVKAPSNQPTSKWDDGITGE